MTITGFFLMSAILACYGYIWKIEFDEISVKYRSVFGRTREYQIQDITKYTEKRRQQYKFYRGKRKIFQYEMEASGDIYKLQQILEKRGLYAEEIIPSQKEHCIITPMVIQKILPVSSLVLVLGLLFALYISGDGETQYIIVDIEGEKSLKIRRYNENVNVLLARLRDETNNCKWKK